MMNDVIMALQKKYKKTTKQGSTKTAVSGKTTMVVVKSHNTKTTQKIEFAKKTMFQLFW